MTCCLSAGVFAYAKEVNAAEERTVYQPRYSVGYVSNFVDLDISPQDVTVVQEIEPAAGTSINKKIDNKVQGVFENKVENTNNTEEDQIDLLADEMQYDENKRVVTALGDVELEQAGRILRTDMISYEIDNDVVRAEGNVVLNEPSGDVLFADSIELKDNMKDGVVKQLRGVLADGSSFSASQAQKIGDRKVIMDKASYTACTICEGNPDETPLWQIKARNVTHHKDQARIEYDDATFEFAGVPIGYLPYFSHPDGSIEQKSGFLAPNIGFDSELGAGYAQEYYWAIDKDKDATFGLAAFTSEAPLATAEYRQRFHDGEVKVSGGVTYSERIDEINGQGVRQDAKERGHAFAEGVWNINDKWRAGSELALVSDDQYLRQYDLSNKDILENTAYLERFDDRNYMNIRAIQFQDLRVSDRSDDQPSVLPEIQTSFLSKPNAFLGGRWNIEASALGLYREGDDQDVARASLQTGWQRRYTTNFGLVNTLDLSVRGDSYKINDRNNGDDNSSAFRAFGNANLQSSLPLGKNFKSTQMVVEPTIALNVATNLDDDEVPNEDSQDVSIDATNLFNVSRFPGIDRIEDDSSMTYGVRTGLYADNGYKGEVFFGQSYRFDQGDNPFPQGSGLSEQESDFVGNLAISAGQGLQLNYALQLENDSLSSQRHEIDARGSVGPFDVETRYFYADALQGTDFDESREQIRFGSRYHIDDKWSVLGGLQYDLAEETQGLRLAKYGLDYQGQCVNFLVSGQRRLTQDSSGDSGTEILLRLGFKNLGEFETRGLTLGGDDDDNDEEDDDDNFLE